MKNLDVKKIDYKLLGLIIVAISFNAILWNYLFTLNAFDFVTNNIIQPTLIANVLAIMLFAIPLFFFGGLQWKNFLLDKKTVKQGVQWLFIIWVLLQVIAVVSSFIIEGKVTLISNFKLVFGSWLGQFFGNATFEEFIFRGFLFLQFYLIAKSRFKNKTAIIVALLVSQLIFAVAHLPNRLLLQNYDHLLAEVIKLFIMGVLFGLMFIKTKNLLFLIGVHSLINVPLVLVKTNIPMVLVALVLTIITVVFWNSFTKLKRKATLPNHSFIFR